MEEYELCIIGAGMIGSCAAYYATKLLPPGKRVCLIGPEEPQDRSADTNRSIFGSYYDAGRILRCSDVDWLWAELAQRSLQRHPEIQQQSGITFYTETGSLTVTGNHRHSDLLLSSMHNTRDTAVLRPWRELKDKQELKDFSFDDDMNCLYEYKNAGYINPRKVVQAYQELAKKAGCQIKQEIVKKVSQQEGNKRHVLFTDDGHVIYANKVLISTGAFTAFRDLLPRGMQPNIWLKSQTILLAEVSPEDQIKLRNLPTLVNRTPPRWRCYMCPPVKYPDGRYYIKIGHDEKHEIDIRTEDQIRSWFQGQAPEEHKRGLRNMLKHILPDFEPVSLKTDQCVSTRTPNMRPFIDLLTPSLGVTLGGCGHAAKSCDEIGRLAADLVIKGYWSDPQLKQKDFLFVPRPKL